MSGTIQPSTERRTVLQVVGVTSGYGRTTVLRDVSLELGAGSVVALLGANGAGKSTLLKTIAGLLRPSVGKILLDGEDVTPVSPDGLARRGLCMVPEGRAVFRSLSVRENLGLYAKPGQAKAGIELACDAFPILGRRLGQAAGTMSGGEQQMLALARAYVQKPRIVLVDEASLGLAPLVVDRIFEFLRALSAKGTSLLIVDQFVTRALEMADYAYVLSGGNMSFSGPAGDLRRADIFERYLGSERT